MRTLLHYCVLSDEHATLLPLVFEFLERRKTFSAILNAVDAVRRTIATLR